MPPDSVTRHLGIRMSADVLDMLDDAIASGVTGCQSKSEFVRLAIEAALDEPARASAVRETAMMVRAMKRQVVSALIRSAEDAITVSLSEIFEEVAESAEPPPEPRRRPGLPRSKPKLSPKRRVPL